METRRPGSDQSERTLIGVVLRFPDDADDAMTTLTEKDFDSTKYRRLFNALNEQYLSDNWGEAGADWVKLATNTKIKASEIVAMADEAISGAQIPGLVKQLRDLTRRRAIVDASMLLVQKAHDYTLDSDDLLAQAGSYIDDAAISETKEMVPLIDVVENVIDNYQTERNVKGIPAGLKELDELWAGFIPPELTVLAARPSMGKTQLGLYLADRVASYTEQPVAIFSLEMANEQIGLRYVASDLGVEVNMLRRQKISKDRIERHHAEILPRYAKSQIYIQDEPNMNTFDILGQARRLKRNKGLSLIVVDYLNLIGDKKGSRDDTRAALFEEMTKRMRSIGKKLNVPVLLLAQLSRECEKRDNKRPVMSDLKESGGIEAASDNIMFLYRENYYNTDVADNTLEIIISKQKQGPRGTTAYVVYEPDTGRFFNKAKQYQEEENTVLRGGIQ